jgi:hypothetical protein
LVEQFEIKSNKLLRTDPASGATTHLLEIEIARKLNPLCFEELNRLHDLRSSRIKPMLNSRSGRVALLVRARGLMLDDGERVERFELLRPLKREYLTGEQIEESNWKAIHLRKFEQAWRTEAACDALTLKHDRLYLATGLLLPIWDKLPDDHVRVSRVAVKDGPSILGREVPPSHLPALLDALGFDGPIQFDINVLADLVLKSGRAFPISGPDELQMKRSLVNGVQRLELIGWSIERLEWYKAQGCFTEIIRYRTRLFVPVSEAAAILSRIVI